MAKAPINWRERLRDAWSIASEGGTLDDVASAWGCNKSNVHMRLSERDRHLQEILRDNARPGRTLTPQHALRRLRNVKELGRTGAARKEGVGVTTISEWMKRNAPDGVDLAIKDFAEAEEPEVRAS